MDASIGIKAVFCFYGPNSLGGPTTWVRRMLPRLRRRGIDAIGLSYQTEEGDCQVVTDLRASGVPVRIIQAAGRSVLEGVQMILATLADERPTVLVADHVLPAFIAGGWTRRFGIPTVMVLRSDDDWYRHLCEMFLTGAEEHRVAAVVAVSHELEDTVRAVAPAATEIMWCPSGTLLFSCCATWRNNPFHAVYIGRLEEKQKRILELVDALIATSRLIPEFSATLYGDGPQRIEVESRLHEESGHRVTYGGQLVPDDVWEHLKEAQALVLFSAYEGLSSAVQEAMACGLPVLVRPTASGTKGVVMHKETGWILDTDDALATAVKTLMESQSLWRQISADSRALAEKYFDIDKAADVWTQLLRRLGENCKWPADTLPDAKDGENAYIGYLIDNPALECYEAEILIERAQRNGRGLLRFFRETTHDWEMRRYLLYRAHAHKVLNTDAYASCARSLAEEAASKSANQDEELYRIASLWQLAGESSQAWSCFDDLARHTSDRQLQSGSLFHLAQIALSMGRVSDAMAFARACLELEPGHRAAAEILTRTSTTD